MKRKGIVYAAVLSAALIICIIWIIAAKNAGVEDPVAYIYRDGELMETIALNDVTAEYSFTVEATDGGVNTVTVRPGSIGITDADCPDRVCVHTGFISSGTIPVVCLPHRLIIEIHGGSEDGPDSITY